jgi:dihydrofolate reductase
MARTRIHGTNISLDGYVAGTNLTLDTPIGGAEALFDLFDQRVIHGVDRIGADPITVDGALLSTWVQGIGAEIMGRRKFGPQRGPWRSDDEWRGWWGEDPPFHTPVFVMTHHPRPSIEFDNGTSFHFVDGSAAEVLAQAEEAAGGGDIRIGGGPASALQFLEADLVDFMHLAIVPITLGEGLSMWEGLRGIEERFDIETVTTASGLTHQLWNRKASRNSAA